LDFLSTLHAQLTDFRPLIASLTICATAVMAASAAIQAVRHDFDLFGAIALAVVTAVGGGTLRDLLIGRTPVFWMTDMTYLATAAPVGFAFFFIARQLRSGGGNRLRLLLYLDAIGLSLFTLVGASVALAADTHPIIAIILGCVTGVAGGVIRDVLCGVQPSILKEDFTATISLAGGAVYVLVRDLIDDRTSMAGVFTVMTIVRCAVVRMRERGT